MLCPNLKSHTHIWQKKTTHLSTPLLSLTNCGETRKMRIVCVSEKCHLLQESEHITRVMVRLRYMPELRSSGRSGKICMTYQLLCWEHRVRKARWRGKWVWAGKEIKLADLECIKWIGTKVTTKWGIYYFSQFGKKKKTKPKTVMISFRSGLPLKDTNKAAISHKTDLDFICT